MQDIEGNIEYEKFCPLQNWINRSSSRDGYGYHGLDHARMYLAWLFVFGPDQFKYHDTIIIFYKVDNAFLRPAFVF